MSRPSRRTTRFLRTWLSHRERLLVSEVTLSRDGDPVPGTFLIPPERVERVPAWIVLHGITRPGRAHVQLKRFTRSLASTGCAVIVPEVAEWRELVIAPYVTVPTIKAALEFLSERSDVFADRVGLVGFSFGAPQAIAAAAVPELRHRVAGVVGFGGYRDLERSLRFQFTGEHDWEGVAYAQAPDPYGRWIVGANYLHATQSYGDATELATALRTLASVAGDNGTPAWDAVYDPLKEKIRGEIPRDQRDLFDLFAPSHDRIPSGPAVESLVRELAAAARSEEPEI
ncbi:MAG: hypothetical protein OEZ37_08860, partial [Gemmatimonadota bacterium]|nr:hypothetical protein [Gemmatimonadota bacterium]